jgi:rod shape-determining protein MreC
MNRRYILLFSFLLILFFQIPFVKENVINLFNSVKSGFFSVKESLQNRFEAITDNLHRLEFLEMETKRLNAEVSKLKIKCFECERLKKFKLTDNPNLVLVKSISYVKLPDFTSIYVNYKGNLNHPKGLIYNGYSAGMVVKRVGNYSIALLNSNGKTSYTVYIGDKMIPGIFYGKDNLIKYIPKFKPIKKGDLVVTSGLDGVFYKGVKVGRVVEVKEKKLYQEAKIKPFYDSLAPDYFYVCDKALDTNLSR